MCWMKTDICICVCSNCNQKMKAAPSNHTFDKCEGSTWTKAVAMYASQAVPTQHLWQAPPQQELEGLHGVESPSVVLPLILALPSSCAASPGSLGEPPSTCVWLLSVGSCSGIGLAAGALIADRSSASPPCLSGDGRPNEVWFPGSRATFSDVGALGLDEGLVGCKSDHNGIVNLPGLSVHKAIQRQ